MVSCTISISEPHILRYLVLGGVEIPISLVSSAMDSIQRYVVVFKPVSIPNPDLKSEFLCQSSYIARNL